MKKPSKVFLIFIVIAISLLFLFDYVDYNTEIHEAYMMTNIPEPILKITYPYIPFGGFISP